MGIEFISKIGPYLSQRSEKIGNYFLEDLPDLLSFPFFNRHKILAYLKKDYDFTPSELSEFLSYSLEDMLVTAKDDFVKAKKFIDLFPNELNEFAINKAVLLSFCRINFETPEEISSFLLMIRNVKIEKASLESFELMCKYIKERLYFSTSMSLEDHRNVIKRIEFVAGYFEVNLKYFSGCFEEIMVDLKKHHQYRGITVMKEFLQRIFS